MLILKFGGTSVASAQRIETICNIIEEKLEQKPVVVVSALTGVTDLLLNLSLTPHVSTLRKIKGLHLEVVNKLFLDSALKLQVRNFINEKLEELAEIIKLNSSHPSFVDRIIS